MNKAWGQLVRDLNMKARWLKCAMMGIGAVSLLSGCVVRHGDVAGPPGVATGPEIIVTEPPPPVRREKVYVSPGPGYVWVPGYWAWHNHWVWVEGRWVVRPHPRAHWHEGYWRRHGRTYVWVEGYWS